MTVHNSDRRRGEPGSGHHRARRGFGCETTPLETRRALDYQRPIIVSIERVQGERRSTVLRPDGSTFAVTIPAMGMDECTDHVEWPREWITHEGEPRTPTGLSLLHYAVLADLHDERMIGSCRAEQEAG